MEEHEKDMQKSKKNEKTKHLEILIPLISYII